MIFSKQRLFKPIIKNGFDGFIMPWISILLLLNCSREKIMFEKDTIRDEIYSLTFFMLKQNERNKNYFFVPLYVKTEGFTFQIHTRNSPRASTKDESLIHFVLEIILFFSFLCCLIKTRSWLLHYSFNFIMDDFCVSVDFASEKWFRFNVSRVPNTSKKQLSSL